MNRWAPLWSGIVNSSLWSEPDHVKIVFLTMLALKDSDDVYYGSAYNLAQSSKKNEVEVLDALRILSSPDTIRIEPQEFEGRRIEAVEHGFLILNGAKYRELMRIEMKRAKNRRNQASHRERLKLPKRAISADASYVRAMEAGASDTLLNSMTNPPNDLLHGNPKDGSGFESNPHGDQVGVD